MENTTVIEEIGQQTVLDTYVATVVSIVPFPIVETKPGIYPGTFVIPAAENNVPEVLVVGESVYFVEVDDKRSIKVKCSPNDIARAIVDDYTKSNLEYSPSRDSGPGIFWLPGRVTTKQAQKDFKHELERAIMQQNNWFLALIKLADDDWEKTRQHKTISDTQRHAARTLQLDRPWLIKTEVPVASTVNCAACQSAISPEAIICPNCKCIRDMNKWKQLSFAIEPSK